VNPARDSNPCHNKDKVMSMPVKKNCGRVVKIVMILISSKAGMSNTLNSGTKKIFTRGPTRLT
jgi:hypothetical protein